MKFSRLKVYQSINQSIIYLNQAEAHDRLDRQGSMTG